MNLDATGIVGKRSKLVSLARWIFDSRIPLVQAQLRLLLLPGQ